MAALLGVGSFAVHQLRFLLAYGSHSSGALAHQGHAYLTVLAPLVIGALMIAVAEFAAGLVRARTHGGVPSLGRMWLVSSGALLTVYCAQELTEGLLSAGHGDGLAGVFGAGGWFSLPLALAAGLVIALLMRGAAAVVELVAASRPLPRPPARLAIGQRPRTPALAGGGALVSLAGPRAPPLPSG